MSFQRYLAIALFWLCAFAVTALCLPHTFEDRSLLSDSPDCSLLYWDTGYGFNDMQTQKECRGRPSSAHQGLWELKVFSRFASVREIKLKGASQAQFWWADSDSKTQLTPKENQGTLLLQVDDKPLTPSPNAFHWVILCMGLAMMTALMLWVSLETLWAIQLAYSQRSWMLGLSLAILWTKTIAIVLIYQPGFWNPYSYMKVLELLSSNQIDPTDLFSYFVSGVIETTGVVWSPMVAIDFFALGLFIFILRQMHLLKVPSIVSLLCLLAIGLSPITNIYSLLIDRNLVCNWVSLLFLAVAFDCFIHRKPRLFPLLAVIALIAYNLETYTFFYFPLFIGLYVLSYRIYRRPLLWLSFFLAMGLVIIPGLAALSGVKGTNNDERIGLLRYPIDLQYDCQFPTGFFPRSLIDLAQLDEVRKNAPSCAERPKFIDSHDTRLSSMKLRYEISRALFYYPDLVLATRARIFFGILGSERQASADWQKTLKDPVLGSSAADYGFLHSHRPPALIKAFDELSLAGNYPYRFYYLSLVLVLGALLLWDFFPVTAIICGIYSSKLVMVLFVASSSSPTYLFDLYVLGLLLPGLLWAEHHTRKPIQKLPQ